MAHPRLLIALCLLWGCEPSKTVGYGEFDPDAPNPAVYEMKEWTFEYRAPLENPFAHYVKVEVWRGNEHYELDGFYAGLDDNLDPIWKARFMPTAPGAWSYKWFVGDESGGDVLDVQERRDRNNHGHVRVDKTTPSVLWHDDGTVHYWFGGKTFTARNYGPRELDGQPNQSPPGEESSHDTYLSDEDFKAYLDLMKDTGHNGTRLKIGLYPLADDGLSWDLEWIERAERWIVWMQERHIYCQITFFDPAARAKAKWFESSNNPKEHSLNAWSESEHETERAEERANKENYIRYIVARFAAYWNVYWELVDRVDAFGTEAGDSFVLLANADYLKWLRGHDPYHLPIGASDAHRAREMEEIDIEFSRDMPPLTSDSRRAVVLNEVTGTCAGTSTPAQDDSTIRDASNRRCYRSALWGAFVLGTFGANEASWLDPAKPPLRKSAVEAVMRDQQRLSSLVAGLPVGLDELVYNPGFIESESKLVGTRAKLGELYVAYFTPEQATPEQATPEQATPEQATGPIELRLPPGQYTYCWLDPEARDPELPSEESDPHQAEARPFEVKTDPAFLERPSFAKDLVLLVERYGDGKAQSRRRCLPG